MRHKITFFVSFGKRLEIKGKTQILHDKINSVVLALFLEVVSDIKVG